MKKYLNRLTSRLTTHAAREALWINFECDDQFAIKVFVGGINAISGLPTSQIPGTGQQDYVVTPQQRWIDRAATEVGKVRQFVAVPMGLGYTVEAQITQQEKLGGIQFEVTRRKEIFTAIEIHKDGEKEYVTLEIAQRVEVLVLAVCRALLEIIPAEYMFSDGSSLKDRQQLSVKESGIKQVCI